MGIGTRVKRGRPKTKKVTPSCSLSEKFEIAIKGQGHNAVYVSTTKGGMKVLFDGHHFKYSFRRGGFSIFQCCYKENNDQCLSRVVVNKNQVYQLDGEHSHFNQATDKSVTSVMFEATPEDFQSGNMEKSPMNSKNSEISDVDKFAEDIIEMSESVGSFDIVNPAHDANSSNKQIANIADDVSKKQSANNVNETSIAADDFREKIKRRLQKALMGKKK